MILFPGKRLIAVKNTNDPAGLLRQEK